MTDQAEPIEAAGARRVRVDWRTGQAMVQHDDAFWRDHEQRRVEQGVSMPQYCAANGLALSLQASRERQDSLEREACGRDADAFTIGGIPARIDSTD